MYGLNSLSSIVYLKTKMSVLSSVLSQKLYFIIMDAL